MPTENLSFTVQIPKSQIVFLENYTKRHRLSASQLFAGLIEELRIAENYPLHPELKTFSGILPAEIDGQQEYAKQFEEQHA